eukprot:11058999-Heterocapsa_arctica.AAC.1
MQPLTSTGNLPVPAATANINVLAGRALPEGRNRLAKRGGCGAEDHVGGPAYSSGNEPGNLPG